MKRVQGCLKKLKTELPYNPVSPLLGIDPKNSKQDLEEMSALSMLVTALFPIIRS